MKTYEMFALLSPELDESRLDQSLRDIEAILAKYKGKILDIDKKGRKKLAYKVGEKKDANQVIMRLELDPDSVAKIKKQLSITDNILRFSILNLDESVVK